jgi:hypothetical protein
MVQQSIESVLGIIGFLVALVPMTYGIVWVWDKTLDKLFGIWNPLENIELETDEIA